MAAVLHRLTDTGRAHPRLAALLLGLLSATGFQPLGLWPIALLAMAGFVALLSASTGWRRAFALGWIFGWAHFTLGNNWIATAFTYQANMPAILGWAAVPLLAIYLAVYPAIAAAGAAALARGERRWSLVLAFAGCWIVAEWLRSWVFTGYSWNPFGMVLLGDFGRPGLAMIAPWMGTYALSGVAVLLSGALWMLAHERRWLFAGAGAAAVTLAMLAPPIGSAEEGVQDFLLVQPDIRQEVLNDPAMFESNFIRTAELTRSGKSVAEGRERLVLWPESGVPDYLREGYPQRYYTQMTARGDPLYARRRIGQLIGNNSTLLTGAVDLEIENGRAAGARNTVTAITGQGDLVGSYAKAHLVPYGEYLPLRPVLEPLGLSRLVPGAIDFWPGPGAATLDLGEGRRTGVQICYEIIFSGQVADAGDRPDFIFNPSNDGWFGAFGPPQHLAQARMRAVEEGLPVLRATTTGISAVIDARGVVRDYLPMHRAGIMEGRIPPAAAPTLFARLGNFLPLGWAGLFILLALIAMRRAKHTTIS